MSGTKLADAYVQIIPSAKGITGSISKLMGGEATSAGKSAGSSIAGAIKGAIAAAGIGTALKAALTEGAALQQSLGGVETMFKASADKVKQNAAEAYKTAGVSANSYMEQVTSFSASLLQGLGGDTEKAAKYADMAVKDMSDNANKFGTDMSSIQYAYQGFAKGNFTMLDNLKLGYGGTQAEMARLINETGVLGEGMTVTAKTVKDVPFDAMVQAIHKVQSEMGVTGTTSKEAAETLSGSFGSMKAAAQNFLGNLTLGQDVTPALENLISTTVTFMGNLIPAVGNILTGLPAAVGNVIKEHGGEWLNSGIDMINRIGEGLKNGIPNMIQILMSGLEGIAEGIRQNSGKFLDAGINLLKNVADGVAKSLPVIAESAPKIIASLLAAMVTNFPKVLKGGMEIIQKLKEGVVQSGPALLKGVSDVAKNAMEAFKKVDWKTVGKEALDLIVTAVKTFGPMIPPVLVAIGKTAVNAFKSVDWKGVGKAAIEFIKNAAVAAGGLLASGLKAIGTAAMNAFKNIDWKSVGKKAVELIKNAAVGAKDLVVNGLKTVGNNALNAFKAINWAQLGKDIISGIVNGIAGAAGKLMEKMGSLASDALSAAKKKLKINSPSKVFADEVGRYIPEGMAEGVTFNKVKVTKAVTDMAQDSVAQAKANAPEMGEIGKKYAMEIADGIAANKDLAKKSAEDVSKSILSAAQIKIKELKALNQISVAEEESYWRQIAQTLTQGTAAYSTALANMAKAQKTLATEQKKAADEHKKMMDSLSKAQTNYFSKAKEISKNMKQEIKSLKKTLKENIAQVQAELENGIQNLWSKYEDAVKNTKGSISGSYSLFDAVEEGEQKSGETLISNLRTQVNSLSSYTVELDKLRQKIGNTELFEEIVGMGTKALSDIKALNSLSSSELETYMNLYTEKQQLAYNEAVTQNAKLKMETEQGISDMRASAADQIEAYEEETSSLIEAAKKSAKKQMKALNKEFLKALKEAGITYKTQGKEGGKNVVAGIDEGIKKNKGSLNSTVRSLADEMIKTLEKKFKINSPSKVMADRIGKYIPAGIAEGITGNLKVVADAMGLTSQTVLDSFDGQPVYSGYAGTHQPYGMQNTSIYMTVNGAPGQDVNELARIISDRINHETYQKNAAWGAA